MNGITFICGIREDGSLIHPGGLGKPCRRRLLNSIWQKVKAAATAAIAMKLVNDYTEL